MNVTKDVYEYLTNFADDKDIVKMLAVNKQFSDPIFFERIFQRKYPLLVKFKKENETWKHFYLRMIKSIAKLQEEYHIPYIPHPDFNPEAFYERHSNRLGKTHARIDTLFYAVEIDDKKLVEVMLHSLSKQLQNLVLPQAILIAQSTKNDALLKFLENFKQK